METSLIELEKNLRSLGLGAGDTVKVHAKLRTDGTE
jgi:aminoglycoside N3'-acetyltransferase